MRKTVKLIKFNNVILTLKKNNILTIHNKIHINYFKSSSQFVLVLVLNSLTYFL